MPPNVERLRSLTPLFVRRAGARVKARGASAEETPSAEPTKPVRSRPVQETPVLDSGRALSGVVAYNEFGGYFVPHSSLRRPAAQRILAGHVWEKATLKYLLRTWHDGDLVHAGTYFGDFLPALASARPDGSKIWAFEPQPESYRCARVTAMLNNCAGLEITNAGLGASESLARMRVRNQDGLGLGGWSKIVGSEAGSQDDENTEAVRLVALDDVLPPDRQVSVIQLDVEGFEDQALRGAQATLERCRPTLVLETVPQDAWVQDLLSDLGYTAQRKVNRNTVLVAHA